MPGAHAFLAPSSAGRWGPGGCPASPSMAARFPELEESEAAIEGTTAHWYASEVLQGRDVQDGDICPETGRPVTAQMAGDCESYVAACRDDMARGSVCHVEAKVSMLQVHSENWGRLDFSFVNPKARIVGVKDLKYGHKPVKAVGNWQTFDYIVGRVEKTGVPVDESWHFEVGIYQPRDYQSGGQVKFWNFGFTEYQERLALLKAAAAEATGPDPQARTGPHCAGCPGAAACQALQLTALEAAETGVPRQMNLTEAARMLDILERAADRVDSLKTSVAAQIEQGLRSGQGVPGWALEQGYGRQRWTKPVSEILALGDAFGTDLRKDDVITPKQAVKKGIDESVIAAYSETPRTSAKLVRTDAGQAPRVFGNSK